ncbi:hypothetical protein FrEUN1fDRAFT_0565 [Parafrankia sp. EUN1f]|nr:glycosyltransferase [Parafrankia sp. EUN1f]EFC86295.1 hypothetical protein FrEUN1fDRAFT_0565 [Parafrankia sp. EUN1f]
MDKPEIRVVVVTFNSGEVIGTFLDSLAKSTTRQYEVVVVDNSPQVDVGTRAAGERPEVALLRPGRNLGYGSGANRGRPVRPRRGCWWRTPTSPSPRAAWTS